MNAIAIMMENIIVSVLVIIKKRWTEMNEDYEDEEMEESSGVMISIGEDGKASIHKPEDYVEIHKDEFDLIRLFIEENKEQFNKFVKKKKEVAD